MADSDDDDAAAQRRVDAIKETNAQTTERAIAYANFITLGGYAGAFTKSLRRS